MDIRGVDVAVLLSAAGVAFGAGFGGPVGDMLPMVIRAALLAEAVILLATWPDDERAAKGQGPRLDAEEWKRRFAFEFRRRTYARVQVATAAARAAYELDPEESPEEAARSEAEQWAEEGK